MSNQFYDRVMAYEAEDTAKLVGGVAESNTVSDDGRTITLKIRPGLKFHSGNPVRAEDVAFSLQRVIKLNLTPAFIFTQLGWSADNVESLVKALDEQTVELRITEDLAPSFVLNTLSAGVGSVVDKELVLQHEKDGDLGHEWLKTHSAGSGAFQLKSWKASEVGHHGGQSRLPLRRACHASGDRPPHSRALGAAPAAREGRHRHRTQPQRGSDPGDRRRCGHPGRDLPEGGRSLPRSQPEDQRLANPKVREAMHWLVDYQGMADSFLRGQFKVHQAFWPSGFFASLTDTPYHLDVAKAKQLLAEAGYPDGFEVEMDAASTSPFAEMAQAIQATMGEAGIKVKIVPGEQKQVITKYRARNHQIVLLYWSPDYMDPHSNADTFARNPDNSDNAQSKPLAWRNSWEIPELTKEADAAVRELDAAKREAMYLDLQRKVQADSPFVIMFQNTEQVARRANVKGFVSGPTYDTVYYRNVTKS